jgi:hypothetical protein
MAGKGGYQRPENPAQFSGPGKFSQRTDGKPSVDNPTQAARYLSGEPYGQAGELNSLAQAAPLSAGAPVPDMPPVTRLNQPTERPNEPLTAGVNYDLNTPFQQDQQQEPQDDVAAAAIRAAYIKYPSPYLRALVDNLDAEGR